MISCVFFCVLLMNILCSGLCQVNSNNDTLRTISDHGDKIKELELIVHALKSGYAQLLNSFTNFTLIHQELISKQSTLESQLKLIGHDCSQFCSTHINNSITTTTPKLTPASTTASKVPTPCVDLTPEPTCQLAAAIVCADEGHARNSDCLHYCEYC